VNQWSKGIASWKIGGTLYISVPFTWLMKEAEIMAEQHKGKVLIGGSGTMKETHCEGIEPLLFHNPCATFTSRGCPNSCKFCAVPRLEGDFREIKNFRPAPVICDNNILESSHKHFEAVVDSLKQYSYADFNQGLEARKLTQWHIDQLCRLKSVKMRFAFDHINHETSVHDAVELCHKNGLNDIGVYVLIGFNDTPEDAHYRLEKVRAWGIRPNPMRYQPLDTAKKNSFVVPKWTEKELLKTMKYYSRLVWFDKIPYQDFDYIRHKDFENTILDFAC